MTSEERHSVEGQLLTACGIREDEQLRRLGIFLIAHTVMDTRLISVLVAHKNVEGVGLLSFDQQKAITSGDSHSTFKGHLQAAGALIPERATEIADEINRGRDAFVHWKRDRFQLPQYNGHAVTTAEGFRVCMDDVQEFLHLVPFHSVAWQANP